MPKQNRLSRADILSLKVSRRENGRFFTLTIGKYSGNKPKIATVVSKKVAARANERNLIKRRVRAVLRDARALPTKEMMFTAKRSAKEAGFQDISDDVQSLLVKAAASLK